jgi:hypothetical protein
MFYMRVIDDKDKEKMIIKSCIRFYSFFRSMYNAQNHAAQSIKSFAWVNAADFIASASFRHRFDDASTTHGKTKKRVTPLFLRCGLHPRHNVCSSCVVPSAFVRRFVHTLRSTR